MNPVDDEQLAPVRKIIPFSSVDGPGNRSVVFLQGCNFNCLYCHNPETIGICDACGTCVPGCPSGALSPRKALSPNRRIRWSEPDCRDCGACEQICPIAASPRTTPMLPESVIVRIAPYRRFIRGITASGGEASLRTEWVTELFLRARELGLDTALDTNGSVPLEHENRLLAACDGILLDVKSVDPGEHFRLTGRDNAAVLDNLRFLAGSGKLWEVRTVAVAGYMDAARTVREVSRILAAFPFDPATIGASPVGRRTLYRIARFRPTGVRPGMVVHGEFSDAEMEALAGLAKDEGAPAVLAI
ncbi:MAG: YjjW family glycine radical enzyme activase [Spirochaetes bacterium]|nr:YjjW family glycine radical enzyme activase [Spirochaetota bacterium]